MLDVRSADEFAAQRISNSINIPLDSIESQIKSIPKEQEIFIICHSGHRSQIAAKKLAHQGYQNITVVHGGLMACKKQAIPVEKCGHGISINRQVQMIIGLIILSGILFGFFIHSSFYLLSGAMALGLFIAGMTGFCGLATLLEKMPWNRKISCTHSLK